MDGKARSGRIPTKRDFTQSLIFQYEGIAKD